MLHVVCAVLAAILAALAAAGQDKPNFSGTWIMDTARSESAHQGIPLGRIMLVIKQTVSDVSIETRRVEDDKSASSSETLTYRLDGSETTNGRSEPPIKTRARWDRNKLITETARTVQGAAVTMTHVLSLDVSGKEMTVDKTLTVQHGYQAPGAKNSGSGRDVFLKANASATK